MPLEIDPAIQLDIYNGALSEHIGERMVTATSTGEPKTILDAAWGSGSFILECLEEGDWTFGTRTIELTYDPSIQPDFGFPYAFEKPEDWVRTCAISADPDFMNRLDETGFADENGYWFTYPQTIYVRYVSSLETYGLDASKWPEYFKDWMKTRLAKKVCKRISQADGLFDQLAKDEKRALLNARGKNGMNKPAVKMGKGSWNKARTTSRLNSVWNR